MKKAVIAVILIMVAIGCAALVLIAHSGKDDESWRVIPRAAVRSGDFTVTVAEVGILKARNNAVAVAPFSGKILKLAPEESDVKKGDPVAWLDTTQFEKDIINETAKFEQAKSRIKSSLEQLQLDLEKNKLTINQKKADLEFSRIETEFARDKYDKVKKLFESDVVAKQDLDDAEAQLREKEFAQKKAEADYQSALAQSRVNEKINQSAQDHAKSEFARAQRRFELGKEFLAKAVVRAPAAGTVFYGRIRSRETRRYEKIEEGDEVARGWTIVNIPDLSEMLVKSQVDETDIGRVEEGMRVLVRVDSFPDEEITGTLATIGAVAIDREDSEGSGFVEESAEDEQVFEITVRLDPSDLDLRPGSTCELEIVTNTLHNVVSVPLDAVFRIEGEDIVYVCGEKHWEKRVVETGDRNRNSVVVTAGLDGGEEVLLREPQSSKEEQQPTGPAVP